MRVVASNGVRYVRRRVHFVSDRPEECPVDVIERRRLVEGGEQRCDGDAAVGRTDEQLGRMGEIGHRRGDGPVDRPQPFGQLADGLSSVVQVQPRPPTAQGVAVEPFQDEVVGTDLAPVSDDLRVAHFWREVARQKGLAAKSVAGL